MDAFFKPLSVDLLHNIIEESFRVLCEVGVFFELDEAFELLAGYGCRVSQREGKVYIPREIVMKAIDTAPKKIELYDREGNFAGMIGGDIVNFVPGSAAINILDYETNRQRKPVIDDLINLAKLTTNLKNLKFQSTALIPSDVPEEISDSIRLYIALKYCSKPVITGTFRRESFKVMLEMLTEVRGGEENLRNKPLAIFDCCPSPPLRWSALTAAAVIDCARAGIPAEFVSMPLLGATAPVTYTGALIQHTAEDLSGVVLAQAACEGAPVIYGGSPAIFDMRQGTTPMGAIETQLFDTAYAQIGKSFGFPTHCYMGLSDSRHIDYQGGLESGIGAILAAAAGVNVVSGPGMLDFESCQSLEKLLLDNEICGMALQLRKGIHKITDDIGYDTIAQFCHSGDFLKSEETRRLYRKLQYFPSKVIERSAGGMQTELKAHQRAAEYVTELLRREADVIQHNLANEIKTIMQMEAKKFNYNLTY